MIPRLARRARLSALAAATLTTAILGGSAGVSAQSGAPYVELNLADPCIFGGDFTQGATVTLTLRRSGKTIAKSTFKAADSRFERCLAVAPKAGDVLRMKQVKNNATLSNRALTIPKVTVSIDAGTDSVTSHVETGGTPIVGADMLIQLIVSIGGRSIQGGGSSGVSDSNGDLTNSWNGVYDAQPGSMGMGMVLFPTGDAVRAFTALPSVAIRTGKPSILGAIKPGLKTKTTLKTGGGTLRATSVATGRLAGGDPVFTGTFKNGSAKVRPAVGDKVTSSRLTGSWTVLANTLSVTPGDGTGSIHVTCPDNVQAAAWVDGGNVWWNTYASGDITFSDLSIASGNVVEVACQDANGFGQWFRKVVP